MRFPFGKNWQSFLHVLMIESWHEVLRNFPTERVDKCVLCTNCEGVPDPRFDSLLKLADPYSILLCPCCGLRWLSPRPNAEGYRQLYSEENYFGGKGASQAQYESVVATRLDYFRKRIRRMTGVLQRSGPLAILDYGAATGNFVAIARAEGHHCEGVELSGDARDQAAQRLDINLYSPEDIESWDGGEFDVLHMNHVLEHMPNPLAHLHWCANLLKPDGLLVIEVPQQFDNDLDRLRRMLGVGGRQLRFDAYSLHHTYYFSPATMQRLLHRCNFSQLWMSTFNSDATPLWPPRTKHWILFFLLGLADKVHRGGNIIEVFARRMAQSEHEDSVQVSEKGSCFPVMD